MARGRGSCAASTVKSALKLWLEAQFAERKVEPNSGLGKAINYLLKRWDALTLRVPEFGVLRTLTGRTRTLLARTAAPYSPLRLHEKRRRCARVERQRGRHAEDDVFEPNADDGCRQGRRQLQRGLRAPLRVEVPAVAEQCG